MSFIRRHSKMSDHSRHSHSSPYMVHVKEGISTSDYVHLQNKVLDLRGEVCISDV